MEKRDKEYFIFLGGKCIKYLFKDYLRQLEDLNEEGVISDEDFEKIRGRILDKGNDSVRFFEEQGENYFKLNKVRD